MAAFLEGFGSICPLALLKIFDENELELLMCGIQNIDVKDWKKNTLYKGDYYANHIIIQWFWRVITIRFNLTRKGNPFFNFDYRLCSRFRMKCDRVCSNS